MLAVRRRTPPARRSALGRPPSRRRFGPGLVVRERQPSRRVRRAAGCAWRPPPTTHPPAARLRCACCARRRRRPLSRVETQAPPADHVQGSRFLRRTAGRPVRERQSWATRHDPRRPAPLPCRSPPQELLQRAPAKIRQHGADNNQSGDRYGRKQTGPEPEPAEGHKNVGLSVGRLNPPCSGRRALTAVARMNPPAHTIAIL